MNRPLFKMILRSIKESLGRFAAIFAISALGVGFLAGLSAATPDMLMSGSLYFDSGDMADFRIASNIGLDGHDVSAVAAVEGIRDAEGVRARDLLFDTASGTTIAATVIGIDPEDPLGQKVNRPVLSGGRLPESENECLVEEAVEMVRLLEIGDRITLSSQNEEGVFDDFSARELTVTGFVRSPYYMSMVREQTTVGSGSLDEIIYVWDTAYTMDYYTTVYATAEGAKGLGSLSESYRAVTDPVTDRLKALAETQKFARRDKVVAEAREKIDEAWDTYREKEAEAEEKFAEADEKIADAEAKIADGRITLRDRQAEAEREIRKGESELRDAERELSDGEADYADGLIKLRDGRQEYADGLRELEDGRREYEDGRAEYEKGLSEYEDGKKKYEDGLREYEDGKREYEEALSEYNDGLKKYEDGLKEYADGEAELEKARLRLARGDNNIQMGYEAALDGLDQLNAARDELNMSAAGAAAMMGLQGITTARQLLDVAAAEPMIEAALGDSLAQLAGAQAQIDARQAYIEASMAQLEEGSASLAEGAEEYEKGLRELEDAKKELEDAKKELDEGKIKLEDAKKELEDAEKELLDAKKELDDGEKELLDAKKELEDAEQKLADGEKELLDAKKELDDGEAELRRAEADLADGRRKYEDGQRELSDARVRLAREVTKAETELSDAERELEDAKKELEDAKKEAEEKLSDAEYEILKAERDLEDISEPKWYVLDRTSMLTPASFDANIEKVASIAKVFPVFFFLIAALVCLTTMTRMVEEERGLIGTMKALGYSSAAISMKYMVYALLASFFGAAAGLSVGFRVFPSVIWKAYSIIYRLPELYTPFNLKYAAIATGTTLAAILGATLYVCRLSLRETPASLILPKAPQPGKRVLLEHVTPIWSRLGFYGKVTVRNLFRYKKRFFMTVIGVMGCTALLVTGFGLQDSIDDILRKQYEDIWLFNLTVGIKETDKTPVDYRLSDILDSLDDHMLARVESAKADSGGAETEVFIYIPEDPDRFAESFVDLHDRVSRERVDFGTGLTVLTEKAAATAGISPGGPMRLRIGDDTEITATVSGIAENYIRGFVYMAPDVYTELTGSAPVWNTALCMAPDMDPDARAELAKRILKCDSAQGVSFNEDVADEFNESFDSIDMIIWVLIVCAGLLAFVVLYNLTNINIGERHKEIATLKVLGFHEPEVANYILRETLALSVMGSLVGLGAGKLLHGFVARTAEVDAVMFGRDVMPRSYGLAFALSMVFSLAVSLVMLKRLRDVSMVESLKAPE